MPTLIAIVLLVILSMLLPKVPTDVWISATVIAGLIIITVLAWYVLFKILEKIIKIALKIKG